jgi:nocardicin nonribosomal peptide synthetase NocA
MEHIVCAAWAAELGLAAVGPDENVFDLGAHSLLLAGVQRRLEVDAAVRVPLARLLEHPTPAALSRFLEGGAIGDLDGVRTRVEARMARRRGGGV